MASSSKKTQRIQPRTLKGFRDYLPQAMIPREKLIETAREVYRSYGFTPIDTPTLEHLEILTGKGSEETDKEMFRFTDHGGRSVGMRFDLTVPFARFVAQHAGELGMPFKRYHIATVWRGEKPQRGRYREFMQCDFDTIGTHSIASDIETVLVVHDVMSAIGFERFTIHVNDRRILSGLLESVGLLESSTAILRALDKLAKIGPEKVAAEMETTAGATSEQAANVLKMSAITGDSKSVLEQAKALVGSSELGAAGIDSLSKLIEGVQAAGVSSDRVKINLSIARGLDYYTGTVLETTLDDLPDIGSVASGGRYDNLTQLYTNQELPGIGASLGLDRLLAAMEELGLLGKTSTPADVFIPYFDASRLGEYMKLARGLRKHGLKVEVFPDSKKLGKQLQYADRRGHRIALIAGESEFESNTCQIKNLTTGVQSEAKLTDDCQELADAIQSSLG